MLYKTICLQMIQDRPEMYDRLISNRTLLPTLERFARQAESSHQAWKERLLRGEAGRQRQPDSERGPGAGPPTGGFVFRVASAGGRRVVPPGGRNGVSPPSYAARVRASRGQRPRSLFDRVPTSDAPETPAALSPVDPFLPPAPPVALNNGTLIGPPGRASGNPVPPEGLPQVSAGTDAALPAGADSFACRQAPAAGPCTPGEGDHVMPSAPVGPTVTRTVCLTALHRRWREGQGPRHPHRRPHPEAHRAGETARHAGGEPALARFGGFGPVALSIFPDPVTGRYKDASWQTSATS